MLAHCGLQKSPMLFHFMLKVMGLRQLPKRARDVHQNMHQLYNDGSGNCHVTLAILDATILHCCKLTLVAFDI